MKTEREDQGHGVAGAGGRPWPRYTQAAKRSHHKPPVWPWGARLPLTYWDINPPPQFRAPRSTCGTRVLLSALWEVWPSSSTCCSIGRRPLISWGLCSLPTVSGCQHWPSKSVAARNGPCVSAPGHQGLSGKVLKGSALPRDPQALSGSLHPWEGFQEEMGALPVRTIQ